jgi:hypothetical protein
MARTRPKRAWIASASSASAPTCVIGVLPSRMAVVPYLVAVHDHMVLNLHEQLYVLNKSYREGASTAVA